MSIIIYIFFILFVDMIIYCLYKSDTATVMLSLIYGDKKCHQEIKIMELSIRNYRAIETADIKINNIALICAHNAQGKTAIVHAAQSCLLKEKVVINGLKVGDSKNLVRDGAKSGSIKISNADSEVNILYPKASVAHAGDDIKASRIACGVDKFGKMDKKEAAKLIYQILSVTPSEDEFYSMIVQSSKDVGFDMPVSELEKVWKSLQIVGWEKCQKDVSEQAKLAKGAWQQITGQSWGSSKAEGWIPEGYDESIPAVTEEAIEEAEKKYSDAIANKAINGEVRAMLEAQSATAESLRVKYADDKKKLNKESERLQEIKTEISEVSAQIRLNTALSCPCCQASVSLKDGVLVQSTASEETKKTLEARFIELNGLAVSQETIVKHLEEELNKTLEQGKIAGDAARQLEKSGEVKESSELQESEAKINLSRLCSIKDEQETYAKATEKQTLIRNYLHISDELSETGVRKRRLKAILEEFNAKMLAVYSKMMGVNAISIDLDMNLSMGNRAYIESSGAEKFIMNFCVQLAIATLDNSPLIIIDGADIIQYPNGRGNLLKTIRHTGLKGIITMSMKDEESCPVLSKNGIGNTYWINDGIVKELV